MAEGHTIAFLPAACQRPGILWRRSDREQQTGRLRRSRFSCISRSDGMTRGDRRNGLRRPHADESQASRDGTITLSRGKNRRVSGRSADVTADVFSRRYSRLFTF